MMADPGVWMGGGVFSPARPPAKGCGLSLLLPEDDEATAFPPVLTLSDDTRDIEMGEDMAASRAVIFPQVSGSNRYT